MNEEMVEALRLMAMMTWTLYQELAAAGFEADDALEIAQNYLISMAVEFAPKR